jgi:CoA-transferase family III
MTLGSHESPGSETSYSPLEGLRVLDLCRLIPGAITTRKLADMGAEVVKVEEPGTGDYMRLIPPLVNGVGLEHYGLSVTGPVPLSVEGRPAEPAVPDQTQPDDTRRAVASLGKRVAHRTTAVQCGALSCRTDSWRRFMSDKGFRRLGTSGLMVSVVGLGTNNLGMKLNMQESRGVVHAALDAGITLKNRLDRPVSAASARRRHADRGNAFGADAGPLMC